MSWGSKEINWGKAMKDWKNTSLLSNVDQFTISWEPEPSGVMNFDIDINTGTSAYVSSTPYIFSNDYITYTYKTTNTTNAHWKKPTKNVCRKNKTPDA